jgi:hypothetical protein
VRAQLGEQRGDRAGSNQAAGGEQHVVVGICGANARVVRRCQAGVARCANEATPGAEAALVDRSVDPPHRVIARVVVDRDDLVGDLIDLSLQGSERLKHRTRRAIIHDDDAETHELALSISS